jgi:hypothetical protein
VATAAIERIPGVTDIDISRKEKKPELKVIVDREKASKLGLDIRTIGKTIETVFAGTTATSYRAKGDGDFGNPRSCFTRSCGGRNGLGRFRQVKVRQRR